MQIQNFSQARRAHGAVNDAAAVNPARSEGIWTALVGLGVSPPGSIGEAIRDTIPADVASLVATMPTAAAVAFGLLWELPTHGAAFEIRDRVREAWIAFQARAQEIATTAHGFGWDLSDAWETTRDPASTTEDMERVRRIGALAGRMFAALRGAAAKRVPGMPGEVYDVEQGRDVERLLPSELALLCDPDLEIPPLYRLSQGTSPQYAVRGTAKKSRGPFVLALDESGSMHDDVTAGISRDDWSKAAAMALARVAAEDGRPVAVVHFSNSVHVQELRPRDPASVLEMLRRFLDGGTRIGRALDNCADQIQALSKKGMAGADVILVTDGVDDNTGAQTRAIDRIAGMNARLWTVAIDCSIAETDPLRARAASYTRIGGAEARDPAAVIALGDAAKGTAKK